MSGGSDKLIDFGGSDKLISFGGAKIVAALPEGQARAKNKLIYQLSENGGHAAALTDSPRNLAA